MNSLNNNYTNLVSLFLVFAQFMAFIIGRKHHPLPFSVDMTIKSFKYCQMFKTIKTSDEYSTWNNLTWDNIEYWNYNVMVRLHHRLDEISSCLI